VAEVKVFLGLWVNTYKEKYDIFISG